MAKNRFLPLAFRHPLIFDNFDSLSSQDGRQCRPDSKKTNFHEMHPEMTILERKPFFAPGNRAVRQVCRKCWTGFGLSHAKPFPADLPDKKKSVKNEDIWPKMSENVKNVIESSFFELQGCNLKCAWVTGLFNLSGSSAGPANFLLFFGPPRRSRKRPGSCPVTKKVFAGMFELKKSPESHILYIF